MFRTCLALVLALAAPVAAWPQAVAGHLELAGERIAFEAAGHGPGALVFVHDGLLDSRTWDAQFAPLAEDRRVVRYDRRGFGRSDPSRVPHDPVEDLRDLLDHLGVRRATLVGSSFGAALSIAFALEHPERVEALVLAGPVVVGFPYSGHFMERGAANMEPLQRGDTAGAVRRWAEDPYLTDARNAAARERVRELLAQTPQHLSQRVDLIQGPLRDRPALPRLGEIGVPTMILVGASDIPDVHAHAGAIQAGIRGAERRVISGAGHLVHMERPEEFNRAVRELLARIPHP